MKKLIILSVIFSLTAISIHSSASSFKAPIVYKQVQSEHFLGTITSGTSTVYLYGDGNIITSATISDPFNTFTVTNLTGTKIVDGVAQGKIYALSQDNFEYIFVLNGQEIEI